MSHECSSEKREEIMPCLDGEGNQVMLKGEETKCSYHNISWRITQSPISFETSPDFEVKKNNKKNKTIKNQLQHYHSLQKSE